LKLTLNGESREFDAASTLAELLRTLDIDPQSSGLAVARNNNVIPRAELDQTPVADGDRIEIVHAVQGG